MQLVCDELAMKGARTGIAGAFRHLPNAISTARLLSVPVLAWLAWQHREEVFSWLLVAALLSDILDGLIARSFGFTSELGALLDSVADTLLFFVSAYGLAVFHLEPVMAHAWVFALVLGLWALENVLALARYHRLSSFHTYLSKVAGYALGIFVGSVFMFGFSVSLMTVAVGCTVAASLEELALLVLMPEWKSDVKGLWWVLHENKVGAP